MKISNKKLTYLRYVRDKDLLSSMTKDKIVDDLSGLGVFLKAYIDIDLDTLRKIYNVLIDSYLSRYGVK